MRRSLARRVIAFTSASVGLRNVSRSVSRTQALASRKVDVGMSCSMSGSCDAKSGTQRLERHAWSKENTRNKKGRPVIPPPLGALCDSAGSTGPGGLVCVHRLLGRLSHRNDRYECAAVGFGPEFDMTPDLGEESMVSAHADIKAGVPGGAALTRNDVTGDHAFATERLDAKALALGITSVTR